ncbi:transporter substrate-binding domain-containing protein [Shewanella sp. VB17]|uniref:substrate-binding periplasmic protein n=1 Tax=Shewanella sp. VB17 TaxID=2739432 RepID=UPI0015674081|nr:transporter substrate-binding domain-containing protein [Shewanella sp. VB17]NRD74478.1 transporter substrate-binding domain-containing protein [Shewanella sp. VB17]
MMIIFFLLGIFCTSFSAKLNADTLHLTSLHWPPYSSSQLAKQGAVIEITRAAVNAMGHELVVDFYPWSRAIRLVNRNNSKYSGYLPEYPFQSDKFVFSDTLGISPLGLVEQNLHPLSWSKVSDLNQYTLGVVKDYVNTSELDDMIKHGIQKVEVVNSDEHNLTKVATARIDAAVMDMHVLQFLLLQEELTPLSNRVQVNRKILANKQMKIAFVNTVKGQFWRDIVNAGLAKIDQESMLSDYIESGGKK